jgi:predicted Zn-dependent protease
MRNTAWIGRAATLLLAAGVMLLYLLAATILPGFVQQFVRYDFTTCTGLTFDAPYTPRDISGLHLSGQLRVVPLGTFPVSILQDMATYYKTKYDISVDVAVPAPIPAEAFDMEREQLDTDVLIDSLRVRYPQPSSERLIVIGFLDQDMYIPAYNWRYAISYRDEEERYAVISTARLNRGCLGLVQASQERILARLRKMATKNIGLLYFALPLSDDPRSVLYGNVGGPQELDRMTEDF